MPADPLPTAAPLATTPQSAIAPLQIPDTTEEQLIGLWLHGRSDNTVRAYRQDIAVFRTFIGKPIRRTSGICSATLTR